jgi:hypothetical protein
VETQEGAEQFLRAAAAQLQSHQAQTPTIPISEVDVVDETLDDGCRMKIIHQNCSYNYDEESVKEASPPLRPRRTKSKKKTTPKEFPCRPLDAAFPGLTPGSSASTIETTHVVPSEEQDEKSSSDSESSDAPEFGHHDSIYDPLPGACWRTARTKQVESK